MRSAFRTAAWAVLGVVLCVGTARADDPVPIGPGDDAKVVGKTEVKVSAPVITGTTAKTTITFELDSTAQGYTSQQVTVNWVDMMATLNLQAFTSNFTAAPQPGKGPVSFDITYTITKGETYRVDAKMNYKDTTGAAANKADFTQQKY